MRRYLTLAVALAVGAALAAFVLGVTFPLMPSFIVAPVLFLCPSYALMAATAACEPLEACSLNMLAWVVLLNVVLYCALAVTLFVTRGRWKALRVSIFAGAAAGSAWWSAQWV